MTTITASKIESLSGKEIQVGCTYIRQALGLTCKLTVGPNGPPTHIIHVKIKNVGACGLIGDKPSRRDRHENEAESQQGEFHIGSTARVRKFD